jgi:hypothetical protein
MGATKDDGQEPPVPLEIITAAVAEVLSLALVRLRASIMTDVHRSLVSLSDEVQRRTVPLEQGQADLEERIENLERRVAEDAVPARTVDAFIREAEITGDWNTARMAEEAGVSEATLLRAMAARTLPTRRPTDLHAYLAGRDEPPRLSVPPSEGA